MFNTEIGSFNIDGIYMGSTNPQSKTDNLLTTVAIWTNAPANSPLAKRFMMDICRGQKGIGEIFDVLVADDEIVLVLTSDVETNDQAKKVAHSFLKALKTATTEFDQLDILKWLDAADEQRYTVATKIGKFSIGKVYLSTPDPMNPAENLPTTVAISTNAPVNSPFAKARMERTLRGRQGNSEAVSIDVFDSKILLEVTDDVSTTDQAKKVAYSFLKVLEGVFAKFSQTDIEEWLSAANEHRNGVGQAFTANNTAGVDDSYSQESSFSY